MQPLPERNNMLLAKERSVDIENWGSYISITSHMLDADFQPHKYNLACKHIPKSHTSDNFKNVLVHLAIE